ncbi:hypothetical protein CQW23_29208 [Capsicum baccatum]|uniref:Calpain catalytic domain-containing protein n=1 Tax=Capsicum baccatum TaxID=33114 RepID=A0A2G2VIP3_CAPBA|nr:hypothetical protein CQW23_29208 [Capsicum baccatum]
MRHGLDSNSRDSVMNQIVLRHSLGVQLLSRHSWICRHDIIVTGLAGAVCILDDEPTTIGGQFLSMLISLKLLSQTDERTSVDYILGVVDDWIPCESPGKPAFATSRKGNEMWVFLLDEAYAKLHGSYEALEGGLVQDTLVDLTEGAGEEIDMRSAEGQIDLECGRLWSQLRRFKQEGFLLGVGSP